MARGVLVKDREGAGEGWEEISLGQVPVEAAFAPVAEQRLPTR